jgi:ankyrin repeat protein
MINGSKMTVTKNVYLALRDLRYKEKDRVLWIDALCIDQNNDAERGEQVQQMGSIYSEAERVIIWLGEATYDTDYVMRHMKQLEKEGIKHSSNAQNISDKQWVNIWLAVVHCLRADQKDLLVEGLRSLLRRSWFKRVWIIQETVNARVAEIVCGGKSVSASIFALMPSLLEITPDLHCQPILEIMPGPHRNNSWWVKKRDLYTLLVKFCKSEATDHRDNIYALLGISSDACDTNLLKANYEKNLQDIIFDTTSFLLNFNELDSPICRFFDWTLPEFLENLNELANEVLKCSMNTGHEALVKLLIVREDVDANIKASNKAPLGWAAENGHEAVVKLLLETGKAYIDLRDRNGQTPLSLAAENGHEAVVKLLLETDMADVDLKDYYVGRTPLSWAAARGHEAVVKLLLETGKVDVDLKDSRHGRTPLSWAAARGHEAVVKLLLETGKVDVHLKDNDYGLTPLSLAAHCGHEAVVKLFQSFIAT